MQSVGGTFAVPATPWRIVRLFAFVTMTLLVPVSARAATCVWKAGSAANFNASTGNWSCGAIPGASDNVYFCNGSCQSTTGTNVNCTITGGITVGSMNLGSSYSATVSAGSNTVDINGDFTQSSGTFSAPSSRLTIDGAFTKTGGTFTHNSGSVVLSATATKTFASNGATFYNLAINDGLAGYWKLDESATPAVDSSGYGNSLTWTNSVTSSTDVPSVSFLDAKSASFNGATQDALLVTMPSSLQLSLPVTVAGWYKATTVDSAGGEIVSGGDSYHLKVTSTGFDCVKYVGSSNWPTLSASTSGQLDGTWHHAACVIGTSAMTIYFDGVSVATTSNSSAIVYPAGSPANLAIGRHGGSATNIDFTGKIDEVRIYSRALAASEIATLANGGIPNGGTGVQNVTGNPTVANDLSIGSGTLGGGSATVSVAGNFWNYGGSLSPGTGTIAFNGSTSGKYIQLAGQAFNNMTVSGTGAWSFAETGVNVTVGGTFAQSAGTFTSTSGLLNVGAAFTKSGGTFTHNSGAVMLSSTSNQTFASNSATFNNLYVNDGLLGYWPLDEGSGTTTADGSGYGDTGTVSGAGATWQSSVPGAVGFKDPYSIALNGSTGYISLGLSALPANNAAQTFSLWAKLNATGGNQNLLALTNLSNSGVQLKVSGTNLGVYGWTGTTYVTTTAPSTGVWHHIAYSYDGSGGQTLYIDGVATTATVTNQSGTPTAAYLGTYSPNTEMFNGSLDDVRIYGRVLSPTEIAALNLGNQPATSVATQTMSGSATVSGNLTIASGTLDLAANTINLAGNWWNYGGVFRGTYSGAATLNLSGSATTNYIRSAGQVLPSINITGTGKWTLADDLDVDPNSNITLTTGSMDIGTYILRTGGLVGGSGTFTGTSSTVVLDGNSSRTLSVGSYNVLRVEDPSEANLVGYWKLDEGQGSTTRDWSGGGHTATLTNGPLWSSSVPAGTEFYNAGSVNLVGSNSTYLDLGTGVTATNAAYSACTWVNFTATSGWNSLIDVNGVNVPAFGLGRDNGGKFAAEMRSSDSTAATLYQVLGTTTPTTGTWYHVCTVFDGSLIRLYVNGAQEGTPVTASSTWNATGHATSGASLWSATMQNYSSCYLDDIRIYNVALSATQVKALASGRYAGTGGVATHTLGANLTVGSTLALDSGGLSTSSYTVNLANSDATKVSYVSGGTYTVGSGTTNFKGGLTVRNEGTLALTSSTGVAAIGSGKTLTIDGTLNSSTGGTTPTIQSVSGSYTFTVGSSATATPVLNVDGLAVKNTGIDGMYINTVAGSSTTFTKFDNLAFSSGSSSAGSTFLRIYSTSLNLSSNGNTFTFAASKPDYAVKLAGNGTADGETRAVFGDALCPSSLCTSSNKSDDDANNNGIGDNSGSNAAVVQFVRGAPSDTAGSIEGFPTAAFDWNTFTYYATYVGYRNYSGSQDRLFVRTSSGSASYSWDLPTAAGHLVGTPRWTQLSGTNYVYVGTTGGYVYKLVDNGSSLALAASPWDTPYCYGGSPCSANDSITSPLGVDGTNVYWVGTDSGSNRKFFILTHGKSLTSAALAIPAAVTAAPAEATIASIDYLFAGMQGFLYKIKISDQSSSSWSQPATTSTINGRVTVIGPLAYLPDNMGHIYAVNTSTLATDWSYQDTANHGGSCTNGGSCTIKNLYVDYATQRVIYGDQDGHVYVITKNGASGTVMTGYPIQPAAGEVISTAPLYQAGIMLVGTDSGTLSVVNLRTVSSGTPATLNTYKLGSAISSIAYNSNTNGGNGAYMVGTASGKLFFIDKVTDSDGFQ